MAVARFLLKVRGEGVVRERGILPFILPQAIDLVDHSSYVALISEAANPASGVLRLRRQDDGTIEAHYSPNPNLLDGHPDLRPAWLEQVPTLSEQLGKRITWQPQPTRSQ